MPEWFPTLGALVTSRATTFRVWAPERSRVELVIERDDVRPLVRDERGYWSASYADVGVAARYRYRLDDDARQTFPDPASRFQPFGVHGPSEVVDPSAFRWTDAGWRPPPLDDTIFYELHIGTFTTAGTFQGAIERLPDLKDLGVTTIELMPVADFPGDRNWGYDGAAIFAPARCYGTPDDLRALVDAAHALGLAVCLDVVYNHLGPDGAYAHAFSPHYFTSSHSSPWGSGVNLDGPHSDEVRRFFIENALYWLCEYHIDALRLDATHALRDRRPRHFLAELTMSVRDHVKRPVLLVAEDHRNLARLLEPLESGGCGLDAVWADDFHHQARVHAARDYESYYRDFSGSTEDIATTLRQGWYFTGQPSSHLGELRGSDPASLRPQQFVVCIQNHDQIGNRADGARLNHEIDPAAYRALSVLLLLAPETPLLFMGQEWAATTPFLYFTDHHEELGRKVTQGRRDEFQAFAAFREQTHRDRIPDPQEFGTFERSRLRWDESNGAPHAGIRRLYRRLLALRREAPPVPRGGFEAHAPDTHTVALWMPRREQPEGRVVIARLSGAAADVVLPLDVESTPRVLLTSEDRDIVDDSIAIDVIRASPLRLHFERPGAIVLGCRLANRS